MTVRLMGVSSSVRDWEVARMTDAAQDDMIRRESARLEAELQAFVGGARPKGDLIFTVRGPHSDPIQGNIHIHTMAGHFDTDDLPAQCPAYLVYVAPEEGRADVQTMEDPK